VRQEEGTGRRRRQPPAGGPVVANAGEHPIVDGDEPLLAALTPDAKDTSPRSPTTRSAWSRARSSAARRSAPSSTRAMARSPVWTWAAEDQACGVERAGEAADLAEPRKEGSDRAEDLSTTRRRQRRRDNRCAERGKFVETEGLPVRPGAPAVRAPVTDRGIRRGHRARPVIQAGGERSFTTTSGVIVMAFSHMVPTGGIGETCFVKSPGDKSDR
jgi:hypothetical protein